MSFTFSDPAFMGSLAAAAPTDIAFAQAAVGSGGTVGPATTGAITTLASTPTAGNTLVYVVKGTGAIADIDTPSGFTQVVSEGTPTSGVGVKVFAKTSAGSETALTPTFANNMTNIRSLYMELARAETPANLVYASGLQTTSAATNTTWNPSAATTDRNNTFYLCLLGLTAGVGSITSNWSGGVTDIVAGATGAYLVSAQRIVADGSSLDTSITWANSRPFTGIVIPLRGLT